MLVSSGDTGAVRVICRVTGTEKDLPWNPSVADLALAQGDGAQFLGELHDVGKLVEVSGRVGAGGQHKDERDGGRRLLEDCRQVRGLEEEEQREQGEQEEEGGGRQEGIHGGGGRARRRGMRE